MKSPADSNGGWELPAVAESQRQLIERELAANPPAEPYAPLLRALALLAPPAGATLLDVGCGVGHYGTLLKRHLPAIRYRGTDYSEAMIDAAGAREPALTFHVREFKANAFGAYDIVLASQCIELTPAPWANLQLLITRTSGAVILHKIRTAAKSGFVDEPTYLGNRCKIYLWNLAELTEAIADVRPFEVVPWARPDIVTLVLPQLPNG